MTDATTVNPRLATLGPSGWRVSPSAEFFPVAGARAGVPTCTWGDSMVDTFEGFAAPVVSGATFDATTGLVTVTSTAHGLQTGRLVRWWNYNYASTRDQQLLPITRTGANTYTLASANPTGLPNGALAATTHCYPVGYGINWTHWLSLYQLTRGWPLEIVRNGAQNGETSRASLSRFTRDVAAWNPALIIFQIFGLNDLTASNNFSEAEIIENNRRHIDLCIATGARILVLTTTPVASGEARGNAATMQRIANINRDAILYVRSKVSPNITVVDAYARILDPTNVTGYAVANRLRAADLIHYNYTGSAQVLPEAAKVLDAWFPPNAAVMNRCKSVMDSHLGNRLTISSVTRTGTTTTVSTTGAHGKLAGEQLRVLNIAGSNDTAWAAATAYVVGNIRRPTAAAAPNGYGVRFEVTSISGTGTSGAAEPTWNYTIGSTTIDNPGANQVVWTARAAEAGVFTIASVPSSTTFTYENPGAQTGTVSAGGSTFTSSKNAWNNGLMQTATGGTVSNGAGGTAPARYQISNGAGTSFPVSGVTASVGASTLGVGSSFTVACTQLAAGDRPRIGIVGSTSFAGDLLPGRRYQFECFYKLTSTNWALTPISNLSATFSVSWSTGETMLVTLLGGYDGAENPTIQSNQTWYLKSGILDCTPPSAGSYITGASWLVEPTFPTAFGPAGPTLTIELGEVAINDVTP